MKVVKPHKRKTFQELLKNKKKKELQKNFYFRVYIE